MKKVAVLYSDYTPTIDAIKYKLSEIANVGCYTDSNIDFDKFDLIVLCGYNGNINHEALNLHHSLLPAFEGKEPVKEAFLAGVKVTGITVFYNLSKKIVAQYPVFIKNNTHYEELEQELNYIEQTLYPVVIERIIKNEPFEVQSLLSKTGSCAGNCRECNGCRN